MRTPITHWVEIGFEDTLFKHNFQEFRVDYAGCSQYLILNVSKCKELNNAVHIL